MIARALPALLGLCALLLVSTATAAEEGVAAVAVEPLGRPARAEAVDLRLEQARGDEAAGLALVTALVKSRGVEAARGLHALVDHDKEPVRIDAMLGLARLGLRSTKIAETLHEVLTGSFRSDRERWAAVTALGAVGDGRDVPALLERTSPDHASRQMQLAAFRALKAITGARVPFVHARWTWWWQKHQERAEARVVEAIANLQQAPDDAGAKLEEATLAAYGWALPGTVRPALERWLSGEPRGLEVVACRLIGFLRLADLAPAVVEAGEGRLISDELREATKRTADRLGVAQETPAR